MTRIHVLDQQTANSIAAGEVVERPASVVKELVENALDADASVITIEIRRGGVEFIRVVDNGCGMDPDDALLAFGRHATSKLQQIGDLDQLRTMGFRGEALASIAAVAKVSLETCQPGAAAGARVRITGGDLLEHVPSGCAEGTAITVENLFFNVPARFKFLRKDTTEAGQITELIERLALARPDISFRLINNKQEILHTPGNNDLISTVYAIYGKQTAAACLTVADQPPLLKISGLIGRPDLARNNRAQQNFYVNGRLVRAKAVTAALDEAYKTFLMKNKYAFAILFMEIPPHLVDVNVHPQKMEVRFWNDQEIFRCVYHAVRNALVKDAGVLAADVPDDEPNGDSNNESNDGRQLELPPAAAAEPEPIRSAVGSETEKAAINRNDEPSADSRSTDKPVIVRQVAKTTEQPAPLVFRDQPLQPSVLITVNDLTRARYIGQLFQTYLLLELDDDLILIDQHAAHEKILFERLVARRRQAETDGEILRQALLAPAIVEVSRSEIQLLQSEQETMNHLGFEYSVFGPTAVAIRALPDAGDANLQPEKALRQALALLPQMDLTSDDGIKELYYSLACKAAIKAHDRLDDLECRQLLTDLQQLEQPYQCPHGRPVIIRMSRYELEKRFKRIV
ncbi:MAG: DNA mismatch repair endonuclease MutL [Clostridiaceae bacterium]|nr:DNA mismatch repair endonuclease MutL [Clostridiaceae bacterium]